MKLLNTICTLLLGLAIWSCGGGDETVEPTPSIQVSTETLSFDVKGGEAQVTVTTNHGWSVYCDDEWVTVSQNKSSAGEGTLTVTAKENTTYVERTATVVIKAGTARKQIAVTQEAAEKPATDETIKCPISDSYNLVWNDEFNGTEISSKLWHFQVASPGWVNNEEQYYVSEGRTPKGDKTAWVSDGTLKIRALKENGNIYSARMYGSENTGWTYCYIESRIKLPQGKGTWPAFWMMPVNNNFSTNPWPGCGEIDIMEEVGCNPNKCSCTIHCNAYNNTNTATEHSERTIATAETDFHTYGMEWTKDYMSFYQDGKVILTYNNNGKGKDYWPFNVPFYAILNLAWGGSWGGMWGTDESALPATMEVDYVRVFQK